MPCHHSNSRLLLGGLLSLAACRTPATSVLVEFETNVPQGQLTNFRTQVQHGEATIDTIAGVTARLVDPGTQAFVSTGSFAIRPRTGSAPDERISASLELSTQSGVRLRRLIRVAMIRGVTQRIRVYLPLECAALSDGCTRVGSGECTVAARCEELGLTCGDEGRCVSPDLVAQVEGDATVLHPDPEASVGIDVRVLNADASVDGGMDTAMDAPIDANMDASMDAEVTDGGARVCIADLQTDPRNCGRCGNVCPGAPQASGSCFAGNCGIRCDVGFGNCDGNAINGCELDLSTQNANCSMCGTYCTAGSCGPAGCEQWVRNTNGMATITPLRIGTAIADSYVYGEYRGVADFGHGPEQSGNPHGFLVAYNRTGFVRWVRTFGSNGMNATSRYMFATNAARAQVHAVVGLIAGQAITIGAANYPANSTIMIDYDDAGSVRWSKLIPPSFGAPVFARGGNGDVYVVAVRQDRAPIANVDAINFAGSGLAILRLNGTDGVAVSGRVIPVSAGVTATPTALAANSSGELAIAGTTLGLVDFGDGMMRGSAGAMSEIFILALNPNLALTWARVATNSTGTMTEPSLALDDADSLTLLTKATGTFSLGPAMIGAGGGNDLALIGFTYSTGTNNINFMLGSPGNDDGNSVQNNGRGGVLFSGALVQSTMFPGAMLTQDGTVHDYVVQFPTGGGNATRSQVYHGQGMYRTVDWVFDPTTNAVAFVGTIDVENARRGNATLSSNSANNLWVSRATFP